MSGLFKLKAVFWAPVIVCGLAVAAYECGLVMEGGSVGDRQSEYYCALAMELVTLCTIPLALKLFRIAAVSKHIQADKAGRLPVWRCVRMALLSVPMMVNVVMYYQFVHPGFAYMAIIGLLSSFFVYPSADRCRAEEQAG